MNIYEYYVTHSDITRLQSLSSLLTSLPDDIPTLCRIIQNLILHFSDGKIHHYEIPKNRYQEMDIRYVEKILNLIISLDARNLTYERAPDQRMIGACRDMAILLCAILREKKIPARLRVGFSDYIIPGIFLDGMCVEYWNDEKSKWCYVDARTNISAVNFNLFDLPNERFMTAAHAWQLCRTQKISAQRFGSRKYRGLWYIRNSLIQDLAVLNKQEILLWDNWGLMENNQLQSQLFILDQLSQIIEKHAYDLSLLNHFYAEHPIFQVPKVITIHNPYFEPRRYRF